jgi:hypothetical protein
VFFEQIESERNAGSRVSSREKRFGDSWLKVQVLFEDGDRLEEKEDSYE